MKIYDVYFDYKFDIFNLKIYNRYLDTNLHYHLDKKYIIELDLENNNLKQKDILNNLCNKKNNNINSYTKLFQSSYEKFNYVKYGFYVNNEYVSIDTLINKYYYTSKNNYISWSFPKGRRNYKESDLNCAIREFEEETNIKRKYLEIKEHKKIYCENYTGDNSVNYEHKYYLAELNNKNILNIDPNNVYQKIEVGNIKWIDIDDAIKLIDPFYSKRIEILKNLKQDILLGISSQYNKQQSCLLNPQGSHTNKL
jgi:8-oxo-dGTP pyrophosphatase MutT (NUDIX family)